MRGVVQDRMEHLLRELVPQVLAVITRRFRDFADAEDAVQEALIAAASQWPESGVPENPRGWLIRVASRRMIDRIRSEEARRERQDEVAAQAVLYTQPPEFDPDHGPELDDTLQLFFLCCHPALTPSSSIALTLRCVGGLATSEIARAFLVPEATMAQRISRAKANIQAAGARFEPPTQMEWRERLSAVLHILYLIFSEGYSASSGPQTQRVELAQEAIRLGRALHAVVPDDPEAAGLLALMLLTDARRFARTGADGEAIPLDEQDRSLWDRSQIQEGVRLLETALSKGAIGSYQLQAAVAALHDEATRVEDTDWPQILALYELMMKLAGNPMVALNHAVASAMVHGPQKGLELLQVLDSDPRMARHHRLDAVRAHLLEMAHHDAEAVRCYHLAASRATSLPEQQYLLKRAARLGDQSGAR